MAELIQPRVLKGFRDILPQAEIVRTNLMEKITGVYRSFGFVPIDTPVLEYSEILLRKSNGETEKQVFRFLDNGKRDVALRFDLTVPFARFTAEHESELYFPFKRYHIAKVWRGEKPQAGRLREHHQFGCEIFGANSLASDIETILIAYDFYRSFGIEPTIHINFLGCDDCKAKYRENLRKFVEPYLPQMCDDCHRRYEINPLRMLDCKSEECKAILKNAPTITDDLCPMCRSKFEDVKKMFNTFGIKYVCDSKLVRGLDYYTDLVFEFIDDDKTLGQNALGGGGRYNKLVESLGGKQTPVIGFGIGIERFLLYLESKGLTITDDSKVQVYVASSTDDEYYIIRFVKSLRDKGFSVESDLMDRSLKSQFKYADKIGAQFVVTIGDDEINEKKVSIKNMSNGNQEKIWESDLVEYLRNNVQ